MKKVLLCLVCGVIIIGFIGWSNSKYNKLTNNNIQFVLREDTLSNSGATFIIKNNTHHDIKFGEPYFLEEERSGKWYEVETIDDLYFNLPLYILKPGESKLIDLNWEHSYGKLDSGKYRVVKEIDNNNITAEFIIE